MFRVKVSEQSAEKLKGLDKWLSAMLIAWIEKNLSKTTNPRAYGKSMFKKDNRFWQYRLGEFRILAIIYDDSRLILLANINSNDTL